MIKSSLKITTLLAGLALTSLTPKLAFSQECLPNDIKFDSSADVYFSEFRVSLDSSDCPTDLNDLREPISLERGQHAQFWFRLQGSTNYARSSIARNSFVARYFLKSDSGFARFSDIAIRGLNRQDALSEARSNSGRFDWRFWIRKQAFVRPGQYALVIYQDGRQICLIKPEAAPKCSFEFTVTE